MSALSLRKNTLAVLAVLSLGMAGQALAAKKDLPAKKPKTPKSSALTQTTLWDAWYIVTVNDTVPYAYFNEKASVIDGRAHLQLRIWKKEEGFINEENIGAFAADEPSLRPLFYNYRLTYKSTETQIDGTVDADRFLVTKVRKNGTDVPTSRKQLPKDAILSYTFPIWLARKYGSLQKDKPVSFYALTEDGVDSGFPISTGTVTLLSDDEIATKTKTKRVKVNFMDADSFWWIRPGGNAFAIHTPTRKILTQQVTQEKALGFLK
jgi:hypothetical protein